jgi:hypothetical protein
MSIEADIRSIEARLEKRRERLAKVKVAAARLEAATLEDFEGLDDTGRRKIFDADPALFHKHFEEIRKRNMRRFLDGRGDR